MLPDGTNIEYVIDGQNRRVGKLRNGTLEQGFLYQGQLNPIAELDGSNSVVARFVFGDRPHVPSHMIKGGINYRLISDHLGSVRLVVNAQTGAVAQRMDYDAWGNVTNDTNPGFQPFGYAGGIYNRDTGLTRFGARDYDPEIGRWTTKDPIGFGGGLNQYFYVSGGPVVYFDATGLAEQTDISVYPPTMNCTFVDDCMAAWPEEPGLITSKAPKSAYSWLVEEVGVKYSQGSICSTQNYDQCSGDMRNAPWRPGMLMDGLPMTELPGFPEDAYYDNEYNSWINSDGYGINWMPYYEKFCEAL